MIRTIGYADVAVSVLTLQRSMLASFGEMEEIKAHTMNALTGAVVCLFVFLLGIGLMYREKKERILIMTKSKLIKANEKIAQKVVGAFGKIEDTVVEGYTKIEDAFVERYLTKDGESVEEAKKRINEENRTL